ncbi:hypothetical protein BDW60DRAFT_44963 [Aspergillus nidulans var. acristatus]
MLCLLPLFLLHLLPFSYLTLLPFISPTPSYLLPLILPSPSSSSSFLIPYILLFTLLYLPLPTFASLCQPLPAFAYLLHTCFIISGLPDTSAYNFQPRTNKHCQLLLLLPLPLLLLPLLLLLLLRPLLPSHCGWLRNKHLGPWILTTLT